MGCSHGSGTETFARLVGTLRVLADGASRGLTDLQESFERLRHTNNSELLQSLLEEYRRGMQE
jgi:hypothetical protein